MLVTKSQYLSMLANHRVKNKQNYRRVHLHGVDFSKFQVAAL